MRRSRRRFASDQTMRVAFACVGASGEGGGGTVPLPVPATIPGPSDDPRCRCGSARRFPGADGADGGTARRGSHGGEPGPGKVGSC